MKKYLISVNKMSRNFILIFILFMVLSCSNELETNNKNSQLNSGNQDVINSKVTDFDFKFSEGLNISSKSIIESGEPHFFLYFFTDLRNMHF